MEERRHVFTAFHDYRGATYRDEAVPRDVHALMQPYRGLVVEIVEKTPGSERVDLNAWLASEYLPAVVGGPVAISLRFDPLPLPSDKLGHVRELEGANRLCTLLHFLERDPRECWHEHFAASGERLAKGARGTLAVQAAFIPTRHGTDAYTDELF